MMRRLPAVKPLDERWRRGYNLSLQNWLISIKCSKLRPAAGMRKPRIFCSSYSQISFGWQDTFLPTLMQSLRFASWLARRRSADDHILNDLFRPEGDSLIQEVTGEEMPAQLAKMLCITPAPKTFAALLNQLLAPVYLRVPLSAFLDWEQRLWKSESSKRVEEILASLMQRAGNGNVDPWSRAVALLTMTTLRDSIGYRWPSDALKSYSELEDKPLEVETGRALEQLYKGKAQSAPAGPSAFFACQELALGL